MKIKGVELGGEPSVAAVITGKIDPRAVKRALRAGADLIEVRLDTFDEQDSERLARAFDRLAELASIEKIPVILTVRSSAEGGKRAIPDADRLDIFRALIPKTDIVDIELSSGRILADVIAVARRHRKRVIVSYHNFKSTPGAARLKHIAGQAREAGADIVKIAATARSNTDMKKLARLLLDSTDMIVIAMGACGAPSRVFFPYLGSLVTYASTGVSTAPGQMSLAELRKAFDHYSRPAGP
jgi:3-dehydroquinate dehydratase-1